MLRTVENDKALAVFLGLGHLALFLLAAQPSCQAGEPPNVKEMSARDREYLPVLLQKARIDNDQVYLARLRQHFKSFKAMAEGGLISYEHADRFEQKEVRARTTLVRREMEYETGLDQFKIRTEIKPERLQEIEKRIVGPIVVEFDLWKSISDDQLATQSRLNKLRKFDSIEKVRKEIQIVCTSGLLVKNTRIAAEFPKLWPELNKLSDEKLRVLLKTNGSERRKLLLRSAELEQNKLRLSDADQNYLTQLELAIDLIDLEQSLREYEKQPWLGRANAPKLQDQLMKSLQAAIGMVMRHASEERAEKARAAWPMLPETKLNGVNLLNLDWTRVEQILKSPQDNRTAAAAKKALARKLRGLAKIYQLQQRSFELSDSRVASALQRLHEPQVGFDHDAAPLTKASNDLADAGRTLNDEESTMNQIRGDILSTWIEFQIARADLISRLGTAAVQPGKK